MQGRGDSDSHYDVVVVARVVITCKSVAEDTATAIVPRPRAQRIEKSA